MFVPYEDPLANYRIKSLDVIILPYLSHFGKLQNHIYEVLLSLVFYQSLFMLTYYILAPTFISYFKNYKYSDKVDFASHFTSLVQSFIALSTNFPLLWDPTLYDDRVYAYTPYGGFAASIALGYFIWDLFFSFYYRKIFGIGYVFHGLASSSVFTLGLQPFIMYYGAVFMMFELSTPFVNLNWFFNNMPLNYLPDWLVSANGAFLILIFFLCRIVWGLYNLINIINDFISVKDSLNLWFAAGVLIPNTIINCLCLYWFSYMIKVAYWKLSGKSKKTI